MTTLTLRLDRETEATLRTCAKRAGMPRTRYVMSLIRSHSEHSEQAWPSSLRKLAGAWKDWDGFPKTKELRKSAGTDVPRRSL